MGTPRSSTFNDFHKEKLEKEYKEKFEQDLALKLETAKQELDLKSEEFKQELEKERKENTMILWVTAKLRKSNTFSEQKLQDKFNVTLEYALTIVKTAQAAIQAAELSDSETEPLLEV
jgi:hypothetical protein